MIRKSRSDKKDTTCKRCGKMCVNPNKLREHLRRKNLCKPLSEITASIQVPIQVPIQAPIQEVIQKSAINDTPFKNPKIEWIYQDIKRKLGIFKNLQQETSCRPKNFDRKRFYLEMKKEGNRPYTEIFPERLSEATGDDTNTPVQTPEPELQITVQDFAPKPELIHGRKYITKEEAKAWVNPNARKPRERIKTWGAKLQKRWKELDLGDEPIEQYDPEAVRLSTLKELKKYEKILESEGGPGPKTQSFREGNNLINKEFERLGEIKGPKRSEKDLEFREQEELETAVKRRAIAVHHVKVPKSHPDNGSDIRKMLESRRKQFREILEKEFDKREQFKFALCSLTKFFIDDKPGNEKQEKKNSRTDWLRNKQIIIYNRNEIDDYLSNAFEQILY
ncbi:hypothetical protein GLOIN_2v1786825 [Rhizophagus irregularis DAOM 181602=DAOM 197198]|uniref:Uncharacterized protein n=1 Tax=Rhizophagus irregularis (strain DAOM 181602 / DAOM 197198 / MUCL 43194) TaxID=747089 RepID=A0A2P4P7D5_RHIID|nr:hypothetical protein GLOIN_2v1786825 [Rhizophagus irregularis DAOM 181602=DAOM 197198]POG61267.1 hypothetical protein GLOIN_2v1786825 [Rhizophagus irregularis DAOM 181602=DAOM 197198]|eukprot:XP_025168133.1 hypothetical protein GLOIN_2v1786825 [Rhizophagus irregularis DAOM 181602=DAOM 197198]